MPKLASSEEARASTKHHAQLQASAGDTSEQAGALAGGVGLCRVAEDQVAKQGQGFVLKADPRVRVSARAHKMSKSRGNVVNPDEVVHSHGADSLRLYEMFMGPLRDSKVPGPSSWLAASTPV